MDEGRPDVELFYFFVRSQATEPQATAVFPSLAMENFMPR